MSWPVPDEVEPAVEHVLPGLDLPHDLFLDIALLKAPPLAEHGRHQHEGGVGVGDKGLGPGDDHVLHQPYAWIPPLPGLSMNPSPDGYLHDFVLADLDHVPHPRPHVVQEAVCGLRESLLDLDLEFGLHRSLLHTSDFFG